MMAGTAQERARAAALLPGALVAGLRGMAPLAVAFSGGLDSRFLVHAALLSGLLSDLDGGVRLYHFTGPQIPPAESRAAGQWARDNGLPLTLLSLNPLELPDVRSGGRERCYACKQGLFAALLKAIEGRGLTPCDGSNASDLQSYRPGLRALKELGIRSPLAEAGLTKADIRRLAALSGLDRPDQRARPCLLTRFAYGLSPTAEALDALAGAEEAINALLAEAAAENAWPQQPDFRLRLVEALPSRPRLPYVTEVHLSVEPPEALRERIAEVVLRHGLAYPSFAVMPAVSGHFDRA